LNFQAVADTIIRNRKLFPNSGPYQLYATVHEEYKKLIPAEQKEVMVVLKNINKFAIGLQIVKDMRSFDVLFTGFCNAGNGLWKWQKVGSSSGVKLLDGAVKGGECTEFAEALFALATYPPPLGLGMDESEFCISNYEGQFGEGFVVDESKFPGSAVRCNGNTVNNVYTKHDELTGLTLWGNHTVLLHKGKCFDPSYGLEYGHPRELVIFDIKKVGEFQPFYRAYDRNAVKKYFVAANVPDVRSSYKGPLNLDEEEYKMQTETSRLRFEKMRASLLLLNDHYI
jgi:hypothetical protein